MEPFMLPLILALVFLVPTSKSPTDTNKQSAKKAWGVLNAGLNENDSKKRSEAVHALQIMKRVPEAPALAEKALSDPAIDVRTEAATVLGKLGAHHAIPQLKELLKDRQIKVVLSAAQALYELHDPAAYDVYYAILTGQRKGSEGLIQSQLDMLKNRRDLEKLAFETGIGFVPYGSMGYEAWRTITHNGGVAVKATAAEKLASDPDPKSGQALINALYNPSSQVRAAAADALAVRSDPALLPSLVPILYDSSDSVRYEAAGAILELSKVNGKRSTGA
jgi:HEAT repeat protein